MTIDYSQLSENLSMVRKGIDVSDIHVDKPASNFSFALRQEMADFIANKWFPILPVDEIAGLYYKFDKETFYQDKAKQWTPGSAMAQGKLDVDHSSTYSCKFYAYEHPLPVHLQGAADAVLNMERAINEIVTATMQLNREINVASKFFTTTVWTDWTGVASGPSSTQFVYMDDYINSNPRKVFKDARMAVKTKTGITPNTVVMGEQVYEALRIHPQLIEMYRMQETPVLNEQMVAFALGFEKLLIGRAMKLTSVEGAGTKTLDWIYGKNAWVGYVQPRPALMAPSSGYIMSWNALMAGFDTALEVVPDRRTHANYYQGFQCYDPCLISGDLGVFMSGAIA